MNRKEIERVIAFASRGSGPVVVLIHGYAETSDSWAPVAAEFVKSYTVVVPDLRGIGRSSRSAGGYDKKTQAGDIKAVVTALGHDPASVVSHDIGIMIAYAYAALYPDKIERLVVMDAPIPGIAPWDDIVRNPALWHFSFNGPDAEGLVEGRERIYVDRIWNVFSADPVSPMRLRARFKRRSTLSLGQCEPVSRSSPLSPRMWKTTKTSRERS